MTLASTPRPCGLAECPEEATGDALACNYHTGAYDLVGVGYCRGPEGEEVNMRYSETLGQVRKTPNWPRSWANISLL